MTYIWAIIYLYALQFLNKLFQTISYLIFLTAMISEVAAGVHKEARTIHVETTQ